MSSTTTTGPSACSESGFITTTQTAALRWTSLRSTNGTSSRPVTYSIENPPGHNPVAAVTNAPSFPCSFVRAASQSVTLVTDSTSPASFAPCFRLDIPRGVSLRIRLRRLRSILRSTSTRRKSRPKPNLLPIRAGSKANRFDQGEMKAEVCRTSEGAPVEPAQSAGLQPQPAKVKSGGSSDASEVAREALRLLEMVHDVEPADLEALIAEADGEPPRQ